MKAWRFKVLGIFALSASLCVMGAMANKLDAAYAEGTTTTTTIADKDGFYMSEGAQVRIPTATTQNEYDGTGIRFTVNLQKDYITQLENTYTDVTFYSLIAVDGAAATVPNGFTGESETTVVDNVAMIKWAEDDYGTLKDGWYTRYITPTNMQKGYDVELTVGAVAAVKDGEETKYIYAEANDNTRTMEAVALAAYLDNKNDSKYAYLNKYYGTATDYDGGYVEQNAGNKVSFAYDVSNLSENAYACVGASKVALSGGVVDISAAAEYLTLGETYNVSIFDGENVYVKEMQYITQALDEAADLKIFELTTQNVEGYYVVTEDIDASAETANAHTDIKEGDWNFNYAFKGTFDGNGHTVKAKADKGGLFGSLNGATITNTNFVFNLTGSRRANTDKWPVGLAYQAPNSTISNVYVELNSTTALTAAASRAWAIALITNADKSLELSNVIVINNDDFSNLQADSANWVGGALFYTDGARADIASHNAKMSNVFVIAPERLANDDGLYVPMAGGSKIQVFASNDTTGAADAATKIGTAQAIYTNVTRYSNLSAFVAGLAWENKIPNFMMQNLLASGVTAYVGETLVQENEVSVPLNVEQTLALKIGEKALTNVTLASEDDVVEIDGSSFTLTKVGVATITATGKMGEMSVSFTFTVGLKSTTHEGKVLFSGADGDVDKAIFGESGVVATAYGTDGTEYTVVDGKITNLTNDANAPVETTLLLGSATNEWKYVTFTVYTQLIDEAKDLAIFSLTKDAVANITGCYLVTKDIDASAETANAHTDIREGDWNFNYAFTGTFDGNGHTVTVNVDKGGLFGNLKNATITNTNFVFNVTGSGRANTDKFPSGLAYGVSGSQATTTISNIYAELNPTAGLTAASGREWALSLIVSADKSVILNNVVVVNNDDFANLKASSAGWVAGALINFHSGRTDSGYTTAYIKNVFVIAPERLGTEGSTYYGYYVPMSGRTAMQAFASNDAAGLAAAKTNTGNNTQYTYVGVTRYSTVKAFVDSKAWENIIPDFMMTAVNAKNTTVS